MVGDNCVVLELITFRDEKNPSHVHKAGSNGISYGFFFFLKISDERSYPFYMRGPPGGSPMVPCEAEKRK